MKRIRSILVICLFFGMVLMANKVQAQDYWVESIDMQVVLQENGNLQVEEELRYRFDGSYNGIYITIPYGVNDSKYDQIRKQTSLINDSFYNANNVQISKVKVAGKNYQLSNYASNGQSGVYTVTNEGRTKKIKVYSPSINQTKVFNISYVLQDVAVKHKDIGEIYYNFIGGAWDRDIKKLNIDIRLPNNTSKDKLYAFAHGPYNGKVTIKDEQNINLYVENIKKGEYVAGRVLFDLRNIRQSTKVSNKTALPSIMQEEKNIYNEVAKKDKFNNKLLILAGILLVYWLLLILKYEKDKKYNVASMDEELFEKYNPLIAGCIQGSRNVLSRDIIAVILDLVNKKYLELEIIPKAGKENYLYRLSKNEESDYQLDRTESYIVTWLFKRGGVQIDLLNRLKDLPKEEEAKEKFETLDKITMEHLNELGANKAKVPLFLRILNVGIFILTIMLAIQNGINAISIITTTRNSTMMLQIIAMISIIVIFLFPLSMYLLIVPIKLISITRKAVNKVVQKVNGQKVVFTSISIILIFMVIMVITAILTKNKYLLAGELLIGVGTLIMLTDNLMLKNDPIIAEDYSRLNALKYKIENYSMMEDREIKEVVLWERYLTYAISFGIASKIANKIKPMINDDDLNKVLECTDFFDYVINDYSYFDSHIESNTVDRMTNFADRMTQFYGSGSSGDGGGFSGGDGGGFSGGGDFSGGGGGGRRWRSLLETRKDMEKTIHIFLIWLKYVKIKLVINLFNIEEELKKLPAKPGVYIMHDKDDNIIYVGKAVSLKNRVRQYFRKNNKTARIEKMVSLIDHFEYIVVDNEAEALILECNLIKKNKPKFNVLLKDDKTYPYIKVTLNEDYPTIYTTRRILNDGAKYFGPYANAGSSKEMVDFVKQKFKIRQCRNFKSNKRVCLNYHIGRCLGPCVNQVSKEEYRKQIDEIMDLLDGKESNIIKKLKAEIEDASKKQEYEKAAYLRDKMIAIENISQKQKVSNINENAIDVIGIAKNNLIACIEVFFVRQSKMIGRENYFFNDLNELEEKEILSEFVKQYYLNNENIPSKIMISEEIEDKELLETILTEKSGRKVEIRHPQKGEKLRFVEMAKNNARVTLENKVNDKYNALNELKELLRLNRLPRKIECYDISNLSGTNVVAGMCVLKDGAINKSLSRRFKIKQVVGQDDPACMKEVISRRLKHSIDNPKGGFGNLPDVIFVDGGITQLRAAKEAISENGLQIPVYGMVKNDKHTTRALINENREELELSVELMNLITKFQDTVHDTAIEYHRKLRDTEVKKSRLDEIQGIGPQKKKELLKKFKSIQEIKDANLEELTKIKGITIELAKKIKEELQ